MATLEEMADACEYVAGHCGMKASRATLVNDAAAVLRSLAQQESPAGSAAEISTLLALKSQFTAQQERIDAIEAQLAAKDDFIRRAFEVHPNLDLDVEALASQSGEHKENK